MRVHHDMSRIWWYLATGQVWFESYTTWAMRCYRVRYTTVWSSLNRERRVSGMQNMHIGRLVHNINTSVLNSMGLSSISNRHCRRMHLNMAWALQLYLPQSIISIKCTNATWLSTRATKSIMFQWYMQLRHCKHTKRLVDTGFLHNGTNLIWGDVYHSMLLFESAVLSFWRRKKFSTRLPRVHVFDFSWPSS